MVKAQRQRILITGAAGLIGSILREGLADHYTLLCCDRIAEPGIERCDLAEAEELDMLFAELAPLHQVIHLAADPEVNARWHSVLRNNIEATAHLYAAAHRAGVRRVIFASSNHVTGGYEAEAAAENPITAAFPPRPDSYYGVSKLFGEQLGRYYYDQYGLETVALRIGSVRRHDSPKDEPRLLRTWLSHRDLIALFRAALESSVPYGIYYGVSDNQERFWSIEEARRELGYHPLDNASLVKD